LEGTIGYKNKLIKLNELNMRDLCIPLPEISEVKQADVIVTMDNRKIEYHFRIESFPWEYSNTAINKRNNDKEKTLERIKKLKKAISEYDRDWELIQIYDPSINSKFIQVLYRKKINLRNLD
jgi:hypothetical protein